MNCDLESLIYILEDSVKFSVIDSTLTYGNKNHHLSYTETRILELLIKNSGSVVSKIQLIEYSWTGRVVAETSLAKSISNIRKVFRECEFHDDNVIQTIPRLGYRLNLRSNVYEEKMDETSNLIFLEETKAISDSMAPRAMIKYADSYLGINFKKIISYLVCFILLSASVTFLYETIHSSHSNFIDPDYEKISINIENKEYIVIKNKNSNIPSRITNLISLAPSGTLVFYRMKSNVISLSYRIDNHAISFTFHADGLDKAKCVIKGAIEKEKHVCVL